MTNLMEKVNMSHPPPCFCFDLFVFALKFSTKQKLLIKEKNKISFQVIDFIFLSQRKLKKEKRRKCSIKRSRMVSE